MKEGSIRERGGRIELRIRIDGKQCSFYGKNEAEVRRKLREYRKILKDRSKDAKYSEEYLYEYIQNWLLMSKFGKIKDSSYDILERVFNNQIKASKIGQMRIKDITIDDAQKFIDDISKKYSLSTTKKVMEILKPSIKKAVAEQKMRLNPLDFVAMPRQNCIIGMGHDENERIYTDGEIEKITSVCMDYYGTSTRNTRRYRYAPAYVLLLNTGMRIGELAALTWNDVNFPKNFIRISKTASIIKNRDRFEGDTKKVNVITTAKTQKSNRVIPMNDTARIVLRELNRRQREMGIKSDYVIAAPDGSPMQVRVLEQTFSRICEENDIKHKGLHPLRHTFGSVLVRKGVDIKVVSEILGHSTVQFTYDRYIHIINEMKAEAVNLIHVSDVKKYAGAV